MINERREAQNEMEVVMLEQLVPQDHLLRNGLMSIFWTQKVKLFYAALLANNSH